MFLVKLSRLLSGWLDWFLFTRGLFDRMPEFAVGRAAFDNWLIWAARDRQAAVVDTSDVVPALHQRHDHSHVAWQASTNFNQAAFSAGGSCSNVGPSL